MKNNQSGFGVVGIFIIVAIAAIIGLAGWQVYSKHTGDKTAISAQNSKQATSPARRNNCIASGTAENSGKYTLSSKGSFSICVPGGWTLIDDTDSETFAVFPPFTVDPQKDAAIHHVPIAGSDGTRDEFRIFKADKSYVGWATEGQAQKSSFTLHDGTVGSRYYMKQGPQGEGIGPVEGELDYEYLFDKDGKHMHVIYSVMPGTQSQLSTIENVLKTLTIY